MMFDRQKARQAAQEFAYTFALLFGLSFFGWVTGWTKLPNLEESKAAIMAAATAGSVASAKAVVWYFTGTKTGTEG